MLTKIRRSIAYALAPELLAARTLAEFAHDVVTRAGRANLDEITARDRGIARLSRRLKAAKKELDQATQIVNAARDLYDNRMGYTSQPGPWAPPEFFIALGSALYGETDERVVSMKEAYQALPAPVDAAFGFIEGPRAGDRKIEVLSVEEDVPRPQPVPAEWPPRIEILGVDPRVSSDADEIPLAADDETPF